MKVYLHLADGFEEIEALTVVDVLIRANISAETVSITGKREVIGAHNVIVTADKVFEETDYDDGNMIVLPGGVPGTTNLEQHSGLMEIIKAYEKQGKWIAAICAAPRVLGDLGLLNNKAATCYPGYEDRLKGAIISSANVVQSGNIITSRGPATAMLFALKLVEVLDGPDKVNMIKEDMLVL